MINPEPTVEEYKKFTMVRVEALNHAIRGLPQDRIRFHLCWGSWHGPHMTDIAMRDIVDVMLAVNAHAYSFEAGNVRHEHEWKVWQDIKLPDDKVILPGVVSHATNVVEHPELVAERIVRFANLVGRERVIASTDCGLGETPRKITDDPYGAAILIRRLVMEQGAVYWRRYLLAFALMGVAAGDHRRFRLYARRGHQQGLCRQEHPRHRHAVAIIFVMFIIKGAAIYGQTVILSQDRQRDPRQ